MKLETFFNKEENDNIQKSFVVGFPSNFMNHFISYHSIMKENLDIQYRFLMMNTDRNDKKGTQWWNFLRIYPKKEVLPFDSFGFVALKEFIIQEDKKLINTLLYDLEKFDKSDIKITLISLIFR